MPALSTHAINTRFRRRSHERRHADRPGAWAARTSFAKPFAHTAGKTLFRWLEESCGINELAVRSTIYFAAVCRCFPENLQAEPIVSRARPRLAIAHGG